MTFFINPKFQFLEDFLKRLPECFEKEGHTIYKSRNEVKTFNVEGMALNVKSYRKPIFLNRVIYTFFRHSKARRAYENALEVISRGFETPAPIAYIEIKKGGVLERSYFVSLQCPYTRMFREFEGDSGISGCEDIIQAAGALVAALHDAEILHLDLSVGNILFEKDETGIHFSLVDMNRMKFRKIGREAGCKNFERLRGDSDFFRVLADSYAKARGFDAEYCFKRMLHYYEKSVKTFRRKREFKNYFRHKHQSLK
ncbi:MAG: lipopolysaccharide kinase InaA family protein [Bacteroidales bacterium]|nr:lipopolysaccharide kinase InaA family protein [Bacteroidales bacterium]MDD4711709.1 lipopolysaccharide kinase InaA family protein [Bacteroidales bacterium]